MRMSGLGDSGPVARPEFKYSRMRNLLRQAVISGEYPQGGVLPGERSLATKYAVSYMTARRVIGSLVKEGILERHGQRTIVHKNAFNLISSVQLNILYLRLNPFVEVFVNEVERIARDMTWIPQLTVMRDTDDRAAVDAIDSGNPTIVLLATNEILQGAIGVAIARSKGRAVVVGNQISNSSVSWVKAADRQVMREALQHLLDLHHKDILFVHDDVDHPSLVEAVAELKEVTLLASSGLTFREPLRVKTKPFEARPYAARHALEKYFRAHANKRPTAIICGNDEIAVGALHAARDVCLNVPGDLSMVCFGNTVLSEYSVPAMTVVDLEFAEHIKIACEILRESFESSVPLVRHALIKPRLLVRESTMPLHS